MSARPRLGELVGEPAEFNPTQIYSDSKYIYRLDTVAGLCKRTPLHWDSAEPSGFYRLLAAIKPAQAVAVAPAPKPIPQAAAPTAQPTAAKTAVKVPWARRRWRSAWIIGSLSLVAAAAAGLLVYPQLPRLQYQVNQTFGLKGEEALAAYAQKPISQSNHLYIPEIGVDTAILEGKSLDILDRAEGVWHQTGSLADNNFVLAGHRFKYLPPNTSTFYNLDQLQPGHTILVDWHGRRYSYKVTQRFSVQQNRLDILAETAQPQLTLYTCSDASQKDRIVVVAEPAQPLY